MIEQEELKKKYKNKNKYKNKKDVCGEEEQEVERIEGEEQKGEEQKGNLKGRRRS
jgi:hypothetical protein